MNTPKISNQNPIHPSKLESVCVGGKMELMYMVEHISLSDLINSKYNRVAIETQDDSGRDQPKTFIIRKVDNEGKFEIGEKRVKSFSGLLVDFKIGDKFEISGLDIGNKKEIISIGLYHEDTPSKAQETTQGAITQLKNTLDIDKTGKNCELKPEKSAFIAQELNDYLRQIELGQTIVIYSGEGSRYEFRHNGMGKYVFTFTDNHFARGQGLHTMEIILKIEPNIRVKIGKDVQDEKGNLVTEGFSFDVKSISIKK